MSDIQNDKPTAAQGSEPSFFVVAPMKLFVMTFFTLGFYWAYCFYQNWKLHRSRTGENVSPFWRAAFAIFFIYPLLNRVDGCIRDSGRVYSWSIPTLVWGSYALVVVSITASVVLLEQVVASYIAGLAFHLTMLAILVSMQKGINFSAGDSHGAANRSFTMANWLWLLPGAALKLAELYGVFMIASMY